MTISCRTTSSSSGGSSVGRVGGAIGGFHGNVDVIEGNIPRETGC